MQKNAPVTVVLLYIILLYYFSDAFMSEQHFIILVGANLSLKYFIY